MNAIIETLPNNCLSKATWEMLVYLTRSLSQQQIPSDKATAALVEKILRERPCSVNLGKLYTLVSFLLLPKSVSEGILNCIAEDLAVNASINLNDENIGSQVNETLSETDIFETQLLQRSNCLLFVPNSGTYEEMPDKLWNPVHMARENAPINSIGTCIVPPTNLAANLLNGNSIYPTGGNSHPIQINGMVHAASQQRANNDFLVLDSQARLVRQIFLPHQWNNNDCSLSLSYDSQSLLKTNPQTHAFNLFDVSGQNVPSHTRTVSMLRLPTPCLNAHLSEDGNHICLLNSSNGLEVQTLQENRVLFAQAFVGWSPTKAVVNHNETMVALFSPQGRCEVWQCANPNSTQLLFSFPNHISATFNPSATEIALVGINGIVDFLKLPEANKAWPFCPIRSIKKSPLVRNTACYSHYSPDGTLVAVAQKNTVEFFDTLSCTPICSIKTESAIENFEWRPDGTITIVSKNTYGSTFSEIWILNKVELRPDQYILVEALKRAGHGTALAVDSWGAAVFNTLPPSVQEWLKKGTGTFLPDRSFTTVKKKNVFNPLAIIKELAFNRRNELYPLASVGITTEVSLIGAIGTFWISKALFKQIIKLRQQSIDLIKQ